VNAPTEKPPEMQEAARQGGPGVASSEPIVASADTALQAPAEVLAMVWPDARAMGGEVPPTDAGVFVGVKGAGGALSRYRWHGTPESALAELTTHHSNGVDCYLTAGLHTEAKAPSVDTAVCFAALWVDADVESLDATGKRKHVGASKNGDGALAAISQFAAKLLPAPALIIQTSQSQGAQAWYPLDRWVSADDMSDALLHVANLAMKTKGRIDAAVYSLDQRLRAGGSATQVLHKATAPTPVDVDKLLKIAAKTSEATTSPREPGSTPRQAEWIDSHPQAATELLKAAGWTPFNRPRTYRGTGRTLYWRHPLATAAYSAALTVYEDTWTFIVWSPNTAFIPNRPYSAIATVAVLLGFHADGEV
jgi:hypothetical protein